jgi:pimeloyl-ACP methyl ester carboxylesterase
MAIILCITSIAVAHALVDDRNITIQTPADVLKKRNELIRFIWGPSGFPYKIFPSPVNKDVKTPVSNLSNLERVDTLHIPMEHGINGLSHHFIPKRKNNRLVVLHLGHTDNCTFNDGVPGEPDIGMRRTISKLLKKGFSVLAVYMPHTTIEDCTGGHEEMFALATTGNPMKLFFESTAVSLNYLMSGTLRYHDVSMIGLSGGGWTTTVYAAIDPRIKLSISVAGTLPLYLRYEGYNHDREQFLDGFYRLAGYPDLYVMGAFGSHRKQIQVLNRYDDVAFGERQHNTAKVGAPFMIAVHEYEKRVRVLLRKIGSGAFNVYVDEAARSHMISDNTIDKVLIPALSLK